MRDAAKNIFKDGMLIGVHPSVQQNTTTRKTKNFRVITRDNNSFILTSVKGNELQGSLPIGFVPVGVRDKNGVAYILSAQHIDGVPTGLGEIGTFPSPDYTSGNLVYEYKALKNYAGDDGAAINKDAPFRSTEFKFSFVDMIDVELQNDYDGSINIIFTDGKNPMRIINSAFVVLPGNKWSAGKVSTNRYAKKNFENTIGLIIRSAKLLKVQFDGSVPGGSLLYGNHQYYFALSTADGNETEIIAQSFNVSVFDGDKICNINGGKLTGEKSSKLNKLTLSNIDQSYSYLVVYVVHSDGMNTSIKTAFRIAQRYPIVSSTMQFVHTGYEEVFQVALSSLISESASIGTAGTIAQSQGYLIAADIKEKQYDIEALKRFCKLIKVGHKEVTLDLIGIENDLTRAFDESIIQADKKSGTAGWNGGYANPKNIYDRLGYWGGEAYPFSARLIFPDGFASPLFPCSGIDNVNNTETSTIDNATEADLNSIDALGGFSTDGKMINTRGIYRFPNRNASGVSKLFYLDDTTGEGRITVNGVTFKIPNLNTDLGNGKTIKDYTIGIQFFRGARKNDAIIQGTAIDVEMVPSIRMDQANTEGRKLWDYADGYSESNAKFIPAYGHILESIDQWKAEGGSDGQKRSNSSKSSSGIVPFKFNCISKKGLTGRDANLILNSNKSPFALISSDAMINPSEFSYMSGKAITSKLLFRVSHFASVQTTRSGQPSGTGDHFSALLPNSLENMNNTYAGQASWTQEGTELKNILGFSTAAYFQCRRSGFNDDYYLFRNKYNAYLGLRLDASFKASEFSLLRKSDNEGGEYAFGLLGSTLDASFLMNVYGSGSQRDSLAVSQVYQNIDGISYFPISSKMYWDNTIADSDSTNTIESQLDTNRKITLYNGDCFINFALRKLYSNADIDDPNFITKNDLVRIGYTVGIINEANFNASLRSAQTVDLSEGERRHPFQYVNKSSTSGDALGRNNLWREYLLEESAGYNKGYHALDGSIPSVTLPQNIPFTQSNWFSRVWHSAKHVPNSFENGYRSFFARSYQDYNPNSGRIIKLIVNNNKLYCIQETAIGIIPMNERIQTGSDSAGAIYVESSGVLGPAMGMISEEIGSRHKNSIVSTDNGIYGVSLQRNIIWFTAGEALNRISDLSIRPVLQAEYGNKAKLKIEILTHDIIAAWNKKFDEVLFTYYNKETSYDNDRTFTVQVNEITKKIHSFYGFIPVKYFLAGDNLYSFSIKNTQGIWLHDSDNVPFSTFYDVYDNPIVSFAVNAASEINKEFSNLEIIGNRSMPATITYKVSGALAEHNLMSAVNSILTSNIMYKNGTWRLAIPKISLIHNQDPEQSFPDTVAGATPLLEIKSRVKSRYLIVEIKYTSNDLIELEGVITLYKIMR